MIATESEPALLGAVMAGYGQDLLDEIPAEAFRWTPYQWAWSAMQKLRSEGLSVDTVTVGDALEAAGQLSGFTTESASFSGRAALAHLRSMGVPSSVASYAVEVLDAHAKRKIVDLAQDMATWAQNGRRAANIEQDIETRLDGIETSNGKEAQYTVSAADAVSSAYDHTERAAKGEVVFVPTGFYDFDSLLGGGLSAPDLYVIAARPGVGKTAFLTSMLYNNAKGAKKKVLMFTLEMMAAQVAMRLIAMESGVPYGRQKAGKLSADEWKTYIAAVEQIASWPIVLNDLPAVSVPAMRRVIRRNMPLDLVMVDYLQLATAGGKHEKRYQEVGAVARALKHMAKEFNVPVVAAAQLSRAVELRASKRPILQDLRESGDIENEAD